MKQFTLLPVLLLLLIAAGTLYIGHSMDIFYPSIADTEESVEVPAAHPLKLAVDEAKRLRSEGKLAEAQEVLQEQLRLCKGATGIKIKRARELLGEINSEVFFSQNHAHGKTEYTVEPGDSLWHIARRFDSTPDLIMRANHLESDVIYPGDRLLVPKRDFTITLDLNKARAVVRTGEAFFKQYPILAADVPLLGSQRIATEVAAIVSRKDDHLVSERPTEESIIRLARPGFAIYAAVEKGAVSDAKVLEQMERESTHIANPHNGPRGIALASEDLEELQLVVGRGTPVTIIPGNE